MTIHVKVPATSANLGGGFDCMGLSLNLCNEITVTESDSFEIVTDGDIPTGMNNLVYRSVTAAYDRAAMLCKDGNMPGVLREYLFHKDQPLKIRLEQVNRIPKTSGMGSSAACIVAGVAAGNAMLGGLLSEQDVAALCTKLDGHPDNVLPALFGGVVAGMVQESGEVTYSRVVPKKKINVNLYTPGFMLETKASRKVLPDSYARNDVVYSLSRAVLTFHALAEGNMELLGKAVGDKLHEPYRAVMIPDFENVKTMNLDCGACAVFLSGAGPTVGAFTDDSFLADKMREKLAFLPNNWEMRALEICGEGAQVQID